MKEFHYLTKVFLIPMILVSTGWISTISAQNGWEQLKSTDIAKGRLRSCAIDSLIYVFGGADNNWAVSASAQTYNTISNEWTNLISMPVGLVETNVEVIHDTMIYIVGGWSNVNMDFKTTNTTLAFDPEKGSYQAMKDCPKATGSNASCVLNDTLYMLGGKEDGYSTDVKKAWIYNPIEDNWGSIPEMIYEHGVGGSACALDGKIYVIGGGTGLTLPMNPVQAESFDGEKWEPMADMPVPVLHHFNVIHDNKILVFGGDSGAYDHQIGHATNIIQEYDPSANLWKLYEPMPFNRSAMTGEKVGNYLYLIGGYSLNDRIPSNAVSDVWRFNFDSLK